MTDRVAHGKGLPAEVVEQIVAKTDGVPLFVEELTKMVLETGLLQERDDRYALSGPLPPLAIPTTLHDSLMARLDRLATVKALAQLAATLGREFSYELLHAVSPWDEGTLGRGLHQLVDAEFLYQQGLPPEATYRFKHALIQDAAHQSVLRSTRQRYHQRIAQVLEAHFPETAVTQPELLAHHYTEAGLLAQAVGYWQRAGQRASDRSANLEAISHCTTGLAILKTLPETPEHTQHELGFQIALGPAVNGHQGLCGPRDVRPYLCPGARPVCQHLGETHRNSSPRSGGCGCFTPCAGSCCTARETGGAYSWHAPSAGTIPLQLVQACHALGPTLFWLGDLGPAQACCSPGASPTTRPSSTAPACAMAGTTRGGAAAVMRAWTLCARGYPDSGPRTRSRRHLRLAQELAHPFTRAACPGRAPPGCHQLRREGQAAPGAGRGRHDAWRAQHGFPVQLADTREDACGAGRSPRRGRGRPASRRCTKAWPAWGP